MNFWPASSDNNGSLSSDICRYWLRRITDWKSDSTQKLLESFSALLYLFGSKLNVGN